MLLLFFCDGVSFKLNHIITGKTGNDSKKDVKIMAPLKIFKQVLENT